MPLPPNPEATKVRRRDPQSEEIEKTIEHAKRRVRESENDAIVYRRSTPYKGMDIDYCSRHWYEQDRAIKESQVLACVHFSGGEVHVENF